MNCIKRNFISVLAALILTASAPFAHAQTNAGLLAPGQILGNPGPSGKQVAAAINRHTYDAVQYGWLCDSTDRSTQAQALINIIGNAGGGTLWFPACTDTTKAYRADSKLTFVQLNTNPGAWTGQASIRFTGPGAGMNPVNTSEGWIANSNAAVLDLRYKGQNASAVTEVVNAGSAGTTGTQTITMSGGTCSIQPSYTVTVSGGAITGLPTLANSGLCTSTPANPVAFTGGGLSGVTLTMFWTGGKIESLGGGTLQIDHLGIIDGGASNSAPFIYATNTTLTIEYNTFIGTGNSQQDAIVLGGMQASGHIVPPNQNADSPFLGYGTTITNNQSDSLGRFLYVRTFGNEVKAMYNIANTCVGDRFMEWHGKTGVAFAGGQVIGNYTEACASLRYGFVINNITNMVLIGNSVWDANSNPSFIATYNLVTPNAGGSTFLLGQQASEKQFTGNSSAINSSIIIGPLTNFYEPASGNSQFSAFYGGLLVGGFYGASSNPHGQFAVVDSVSTASGSFQMNVDSSGGNMNLDSVSLNGSSFGLPIIIGKHLAPVNTPLAWLNTSAVPTLSSCGTTPPTPTGGNEAGNFVTGTGAPLACTVTFANAYPNYAACTISPTNAAAVGISGGTYISAQSKTAFTITMGSGTSSAAFSYTCKGS